MTSHQPCGTPRNHAEEIANARYGGNSPESDEPPSRDPFLYMPRPLAADEHTGPWAHPPRKPERHSPGTAIFVWVALVCIAFAVWVVGWML